MRRALFHAGRAEGVTTPNPLVGAVIVSPDGVVVGQGRHPRAGAPHAEAFAIEDAGDRARGATMFVNLEPCCHTGRTGPCTKRIIAAGLRRVVAAMADPNPVVSGKGFDELRAQRHRGGSRRAGRRGAASQSRVHHRADRRPPHGHRQGGDQHGFEDRRRAGSAHATDVGRGEPPDAAAARRGRCDWHRVGNAAGR